MVRLTGFGKFSVSQRAPRQGRNPQTGERMQIAAKRVPKFAAGSELKKAVR
jgi:DNA-binding protein HU-beta